MIRNPTALPSVWIPSGVPLPGLPHRLMVQARQIASFALAALNGYGPPGGAEMAGEGCAAMIRRYWQADGLPGWVFSLNPDGTVADTTRDTYAHAFALFALSWGYRLQEPQAAARADYKRVAKATLDFLDRELAVPGDGFQGYRTASPDPGGLSQNPHMHLFEALLSWFEASGDMAFMARAQAMADLALERFVDADSGALLEFYGDGWTAAPGLTGRIVEPGHCHEWAWLLLRYGRLSGEDLTAPAERLYQFACTHGEDVDGLVFDQVIPDGTAHERGKRIWPQAEALKADAAFARMGHPAAEARIAARIEGLFAQFLDDPIAGGWIDHRDADGHPKVDYVPASTLYHLAFSVEALDDYAQTNSCR
jgi:mannose/cellobiose epimerase-like protein (N-acyl-D-glucosamine 2-epimerase family)